MKKKIIAMLLLFCMACGVLACGKDEGEKSDKKGKKEQVSVVTIDGKDYDLSDDFRDVVGAMVKGGLGVAEVSTYRLYDEDGKVDKDSRAENGIAEVYAREMECFRGFAPEEGEEIEEEFGFFIRNDFYLDHMVEKEIESGLGIASVEDAKKKLDTKEYLEINKSLMAVGEVGYIGVFVDGKAVDFSDYEDALEELKEFTGEGTNTILSVHFPHYTAFSTGRLTGDIFRTCHSYEELEAVAERIQLSLEEELLLQFALEDGFTQLTDGTAERITVVNFGIPGDEEDLNMAYSEFYFSEEWN